jgi:uncharacterized protein (TIGR03000 family)
MGTAPAGGATGGGTGGGAGAGGTGGGAGGGAGKSGGEMGLISPAPATIVVSLPAEAKLLIDDHATTSTSTLRRFASPPLEPGKEFHYTLKAEMVRDGSTVVATKQVSVRAGQETRVTLDFPSASVASR